MTALQMSLRQLLIMVAAKHKHRYCYPSVATIRKLLREKYGLDRSVRQILRTLKTMEDAGEIDRNRRVKHLPNDQWRQMSTIYRIGHKIITLAIRTYWQVRWALKNLRVTLVSYHQTSLGSGSEDIACGWEKNTEKDEKKPPPEQFRQRFEAFKAFCQAL